MKKLVKAIVLDTLLIIALSLGCFFLARGIYSSTHRVSYGSIVVDVISVSNIATPQYNPQQGTITRHSSPTAYVTVVLDGVEYPYVRIPNAYGVFVGDKINILIDKNNLTVGEFVSVEQRHSIGYMDDLKQGTIQIP